MPRRLPVFVAAFLGAWLVQAPAAPAHPHVWIDVGLSMAFDSAGRATSLEIVWRLDELYSQTAIAGLDRNGDGLYTPAELQPLIQDGMQNLDAWFYFTDIRADGARLPTGPARDYRAHMDGDRLVYTFTLPLDTPTRPGPDGLRLRAFDPSLYIGLELEKTDPVRLVNAPDSCSYRITPAPGFEEALLLGESTFDQEVEPGTDGLGGRFAETVIVTCD